MAFVSELQKPLVIAVIRIIESTNTTATISLTALIIPTLWGRPGNDFGPSF